MEFQQLSQDMSFDTYEGCFELFNANQSSLNEASSATQWFSDSKIQWDDWERQVQGKLHLL